MTQAQSRRGNQAHGHNPHPAPQMQIGPRFRIQTAINVVAAKTFDIPQTDDGRHFCLSYHLKGVCNTHCSGLHSHRPLYQSEFGRLGEWRERFYNGDEAPLVREVDTGGRSQASTLSAQTGRP